MSAQPVPAPARAPRRTTAAPAPVTTRRQRSRLTVVPSPVPARSRAPFVALLAAILLAALATVLVLNIRMAEAAYALHDRQMDLALVEESVAALEVEIDAAGASSVLDERAQELGMTRPQTTYFIELESGEITGGPTEEGTN
ncbi:hypothetical protein ACPYO6_01125 [Georgenia sp. Z1344]|uniref:hypothetical protein n=1 Tax=Georgenia sp. Z1344 TaxID=3416706 RepID=UPI003CF4E24D